jgi:Flp pilus assembly protein TadB
MDDRLALLFGVGLGLLAPIAVLNHARDKRMKKLVAQLPDALDIWRKQLLQIRQVILALRAIFGPVFCL